jgi:RNA 3'-terminal phosphate cyclase (ATP)
MAPPAGYVLHVLLPLLRRLLGIHAELELVRRGFFPKGQGQVVLTVQPLQPGAHLPAIDMTERGAITSIAIRAFTAGKIAPAVGQRLAAAAHKGARGAVAQGWVAVATCLCCCWRCIMLDLAVA